MMCEATDQRPGRTALADAYIHSQTDTHTTGAPSILCFSHAMVSLAEMARELRAKRTRVGLEVAGEFGRIGGRK